MKLSVNTEDVVLVIINSAGYIVEKIQLKGSEFISIDLSRYPNGAYLLRSVNSFYYSEAVKIIKE